MPTIAANAAGFLALWVVGLLAAGGAASCPGGLLIGAPSWAALVLISAVLAVVWRCGSREAVAWAPLLLVPAWLLLARFWPGVAALSGAPLWALFLAGLTSLVATARLQSLDRIFVPVVLALYFVVAGRVQSSVGPQGDEPHYLMVADSLLRDHDLDLTRDYAEGRYRSFHPRPLEPHYRVRGSAGEIYSVHALGLSLLVLPAYALGGYAGASFFMALLAALLGREIRAVVRAFTGQAALASGVAWAVALSPPLIHYVGLVFTEVPAALILAFGLRRAHEARSLESRAALVWGTALAFLPWLNVRYAVFPVVLVAYALWERMDRRALAAVLAPLAVSALVIGCFHFSLYGFFDPRRVYGRTRELAFGTLAEGVPGLFFDQEFGLLSYAPLFALALPGFWRLWRPCRRDAVMTGALVLLVVGTAGSWDMWRGGFNPPARFLLPLVPVLAILVARALDRGLGAPAALLVGWSLWTGLAGAAHPELVHRDRDGTAPFFRANSGAEEWTRLLPSYVLAEDDRSRLTLVWAAALALAVFARGSQPTSRSVGLSLLGLLAAAGAASHVGVAKTGGRDAVRLLGHQALSAPQLARFDAAHALWGPKDLGWGPLFEPHRYPDGATLGDRLRLPAGRYALRLEAESLIPLSDPPELTVRDETPEARASVTTLALEAGPAWSGEFTIEAREPGAVRLAIRGGSPFVLKAIDLRRSTLLAPAGLIR